MPERTVSVSLVAQVSGYITGMEKAARSTRDLGTEAEKLAAKRQAFEDLGRPLLAFGAIAAAAVGIAIKKFADFDAQMSNVQAVTQATTSDMGLLRDAALDAGGRTVFTATEAAQALEELGKAGFDTATSISALDGTLGLAASSQLEVARASEIVATTLKQYGLAGSEAGRVSDVLAAGAGKALGSVEDLAQGLKFVGPVAASMGISLEETTGALALFADQGIIGEQAGTSLRGVLASLTSPSKEAAKEIERLGINLYDSNNAFIGVEGLAGELGDAFQGADDKTRDFSLGLIFGNQQVTAARVLFQGGAEAIAKYTAEVQDAGYAARVAADRMDNLSGDIEKLGGAFDTALIKSGSGANNILREMTQTLTFLVDEFGNLPEPVLGVGLAMGTVLAATALAGGGFLTLVPRIAAVKVAMGNIGTGALVGKIGVLGGALAVATGYMAFFATTAADAKATTQAFKDTLDPATGALTKYTKAWIAKSVAESDWIGRSAKDIGVTQGEIVDAIFEGGKKLDDLNSKLTGQNNIIDFFNGSGVAAGNAKQSIRELTNGLERSQEELKNEKDALGETVPALDGTRVGVDRLAESTLESADAVTSWLDAVAEQDAAFIDLQGGYGAVIQANKDYAQSTADSTVDSTDSWETYYDGFAVNVADYLAELQRQVDAQNNWESNMVLLSGRVSSGVLDELAKLGPEGAPLVASLVTASDEQLAELEGVFAERGEAATGAFTNALATAGPVIVAATAQLGEAAATEIADKLAAGTHTVQDIVNEYGLIIEGYKPEVQVSVTDAMNKVATYGQWVASQSYRIGLTAYISNPGIAAQYAFNNSVTGGYSRGGYTGDGAVDEAAGIVHRKEWVSDAETTAIPANRAALEYMHAGGDMAQYGAAPVYQSAPAAMYMQAPSVAAQAAPVIQRVEETVKVMLPNGKELASFMREYDRSLR